MHFPAAGAFVACRHQKQYRPQSGTLDLSTAPGAALPKAFVPSGRGPLTLPSTCPRQQGRYFPRKHSRAQPGSRTVTAPLARLAARKSAAAAKSKPSSQEPPEAGAGPESHAGHPDSPAAERRAQEACSGRSKSPWYSLRPLEPLLPEGAGVLRVRNLLSTLPTPHPHSSACP